MRTWTVFLFFAVVILFCGCREQGENSPVAALRAKAGPPPGASPSPVTGYCYGVLVGVADYPGMGSDLMYADNDAWDMAQALMADSERWHWARMTLLVDSAATAAAVRQAVQEMVQAAGPDDTVLFYFSGHGTTVDDDNADELDGLDEVICAYDEDIRDDEMASWFSGLATQRLLVILDTCFSSDIIGKGRGKKRVKGIPGAGRPRKGDGFLRDLMAGRKDISDLGFGVALASSDAGESSFENNSFEHGVFTHFLLEALDFAPVDADVSGLLSAEEAHQWLEPKVTGYEPGQHPQLFDSYPGEFEFVGAGVNQPPPPLPDDAYEDNDTLASATDLTTQADQWLSNLLAVHQDMDYYEIAVSGTDLTIQVDVRFSAAGGDIDVYLFNDAGEEVAWSESFTDDELIDYVAPGDGTFYIRVELFEGTSNSYQLLWSALPTPADDLYENNDTLASATDLTTQADQWISNLISVQSDLDYYEIAVSGTDLSIQVDVRFSAAGGDIDVYLFNDADEEVAWSESATDDEFIDFVAPAGGTYYILVDLYEGTSNSYQLLWSALPAPADDLYENNDTLASATDLTTQADLWISNLISVRSDLDYYEIAVSGADLRIQVDVRFSHAGGDIDVDLLDDSGMYVAASASYSDDEFIDFVAPAGGTYYILVDIYEGTSNSYQLMWSALPLPSDDPYEENDDAATAADITSQAGAWITDLYCWDEDWYEITVPAGQTRLRVYVNFTNANGDIDIELYDVGEGYMDGSDSMDDNETLDITLTSSGTYYIRVYFYNTAGNTYSLLWETQAP